MEDLLISILGGNISRPRASALLRDAGGSVEVAVAIHFSEGVAAHNSSAPNPVAQLRDILGRNISEARLLALLRANGHSVERSVEAYYLQANQGLQEGAQEHTTLASPPPSHSLQGPQQVEASLLTVPAIVTNQGDLLEQRLSHPGSSRDANTTGVAPSYVTDTNGSPATNAAIVAPTAGPSTEVAHALPGPGTIAGGSSLGPPADTSPPGIGNEARLAFSRLLSSETLFQRKVQQPAYPSSMHLPLQDLRTAQGHLYSDCPDKVEQLLTQPRLTEVELGDWPKLIGYIRLPIDPENQYHNPSMLESIRTAYADGSMQHDNLAISFVGYTAPTCFISYNAGKGKPTKPVCAVQNDSTVQSLGRALRMLTSEAGWVTLQLSLVDSDAPYPADQGLPQAAAGGASAKQKGKGKARAATVPGSKRDRKSSAVAGAEERSGSAKKARRAKAAKATADESSAAESEEESAAGSDIAVHDSPLASGQAAGPSEPAAPPSGGRRKGRARRTQKTCMVQIAVLANSHLFSACSVNASGAFDGDIQKGPTSRTNSVKTTSVKICEAFATVLQAILMFGDGLWIGPDSDGAINLCEDTAAAEYGLATAANGEAAAGPSTSAASAQQAAPNGSASGNGTGSPAAACATMDVGHLLSSIKLRSDAKEAVAPPYLNSHPKHYQLQGLQWMLQRERQRDALGRGILFLHPAWVQFVASSGLVFYVHRWKPFALSLQFIPAHVGGTCGGFLCDEMGLGKTLQVLMLALSNPAPEGWAAPEAEPASASGPEEPCPIKTSLVVMPANLLEQWAEEIRTHLKPGSLSVCTYEGSDGVLHEGPQEAAVADGNANGSKRPRRSTAAAQKAPAKEGHDASLNGSHRKRGALPRLPVIMCRGHDALANKMVEMRTCDVCLMSYETLRKELSRPDSALLRYGFWRVVLDEAQLVANSSSVAAQMASSLWRRQAWVVTGTPITSRLGEIQGLCEFLDYKPYYTETAWRSLLAAPYDSRSAAGLVAMRGLLRGVMLRREKGDVEAQLQLPPCTREDRMVQLSAVERLCYDRVKDELDAALGQMRIAAARPRDRTQPKSTSTKAVSLLTALRQSCCHPQIVRRQDDMLGKERLSERQVLGRLVLHDYGEYDMLAGQWMSSRIQLAALKDTTEPGDELPGGQLEVLMTEIAEICELVERVDVDRQAEMRQQGSHGASSSRAAGSQHGTELTELHVTDKAKEAARDRWRRWKKLHLEALVLQALLLKRAFPDAARQLAAGAGGAGPAGPGPSSTGAGAEGLEPAREGLPQTAVADAKAKLQEVQERTAALRLELGITPRVAEAAEVRRSKRTRAAAMAEEEPPSPDALDAYERSQAVIRDFDLLLKKRRPADSCNGEITRLNKQMSEKLHNVNHLMHLLRKMGAAADNGGEQTPTAEASTSAPASGSAAEENVCCICLDIMTRVTLTSCGHTFCSDCIHECVQSRGNCPMCRKELSRSDLFDCVPDAEAQANAAARAAAAAATAGAGQDYGAKVTALLTELGSMREREPGAKAVVFSSWVRLLQLVGSALGANHMHYASMVGGDLESRQQALHQFLHDPNCQVLLLLMSNGSGAAGLTLTVASTAFIMEPALNPGLEAQAAARIYRLGQSRPTRVIRFIAAGTVEANVLELQQHKLRAGTGPTSSQLEEVDTGTMLRFFGQP